MLCATGDDGRDDASAADLLLASCPEDDGDASPAKRTASDDDDVEPIPPPPPLDVCLKFVGSPIIALSTARLRGDWEPDSGENSFVGELGLLDDGGGGGNGRLCF